MGAPIDGQRNLKKPYANRGFQTPYSQVRNSVDPNPPPPSSYSTTTHAATSVHREGMTSPVQQTPVRSRFSDRDALRAYNYNITPWHLYPKADSANIIDRQKKATGTLGGTVGDTADILTVYLTDTGTASNNFLSSASGRAGTPTMEFYRIKKFGHALLNGETGITYQLIVDGEIALDWVDFQLSPSAPYNDLWVFENPIVVKNSLVFRAYRSTAGSAYDFSTSGNEVDAVIVGWSEQYTASAETSHPLVE